MFGWNDVFYELFEVPYKWDLTQAEKTTSLK